MGSGGNRSRGEQVRRARTGRDLPATLAFLLLLVVPAGSAIGLYELLRVLPGGLPGDMGAFIGIMLVPALLTALVSRWACNRQGVEAATAWSIIAAASVIAVVCGFLAVIVFGVAHSE